MDNIIITFSNNDKKEYKKGIKLKEIIEDIKKDYKFDIICAKFKNQLIGYEDAIMKSGTLELFDITTSQGNKIYERGLIYLFETCTLRILGKDTIIKIRHPIDKGIYCEIDKKVTEKDIEKIKELNKITLRNANENTILVVICDSYKRMEELCRRIKESDENIGNSILYAMEVDSITGVGLERLYHVIDNGKEVKRTFYSIYGLI